jgi:hypothetical protein
VVQTLWVSNFYSEVIVDRTAMTSSKPNPIFRLMPSLTDVAFLLPIIFLFTRLDGVRTMLGDGDTGWHVRTGEWILANHAVPRADMFSFTRPGQPWVAWEWLWDAGAAWLHQHWGLGAVVLASMAILCITFALLFRLVNRRSQNALIAIAVTALAASGSAIHWLARPHLVSWLFIVIFLSILERVREGRVKLLWWLPVLMIAWTNLHGGFLAGFIVVGAYAGGEVIRAIVSTRREEALAALRGAVPYILATLGCMAASLINPYSYHLHEHILGYLRDPYQMLHINEFLSLSFQNPAARYFEIMLALGLGAAVAAVRARNFVDALMIVGWAHLALLSARNIPIFMISAAPVVAPALATWLAKLSEAPLPRWMQKAASIFPIIGEEIGPLEKIARAHLVSLTALVVIALGMRASAGDKLKPEYDPKRYPSGALALLERPEGRIFTDDEWGDYLIYNLSPKGVKVYVDGRSDFYGGKFCEEYIDLLGVKYDWEQTLAKYSVDTVLLSPKEPLASTLKESSHWRVVYDDGSAIVFRPSRGGGEQVSTSRIGGEDRGLAITQSKTKNGGSI